jgi:rRNA maturation endonuclease Nob1
MRYSMVMCIRCRRTSAPEPLGFCAACAMHTRVEVVDGLKRLARYLAAWAAFDEWLRARGVA